MLVTTPPKLLAEIAYECGVVQSLYYACTEVYHVGKEDVGLGPEKQAARAAMSDVASKLIDNAMEKHVQRLKALLAIPVPAPGGPDSEVNAIYDPENLDTGDGTEKETL